MVQREQERYRNKSTLSAKIKDYMLYFSAVSRNAWPLQPSVKCMGGTWVTFNMAPVLTM